MVDADGGVVVPVAAYLKDVQACGRSEATLRSYSHECRRRHYIAYDFTVFGDFSDELRNPRNRSTTPTGLPSSSRTVHDTASHGITTRCTRTESPCHLRDGRGKITTSTTSDTANRRHVVYVKDRPTAARDNVPRLHGEPGVADRGDDRPDPARLAPAARPGLRRTPPDQHEPSLRSRKETPGSWNPGSPAGQPGRSHNRVQPKQAFQAPADRDPSAGRRVNGQGQRYG